MDAMEILGEIDKAVQDVQKKLLLLPRYDYHSQAAIDQASEQLSKWQSEDMHIVRQTLES